MNYPISRRKVIAGLGLLGVAMIAGCENKQALSSIHGTDLSDENFGRSFTLTDPQGKERTLADFHGKIPMVFFGFTQCPVVCPTTLARAARIKKLLGADGDRLQVIFITLDPDRDTPQVLEAYVHAFDPSFIGLYGNTQQTADAVKEFKIYYQRIAAGDTYTLAHTATTYVLDANGKLRLSLSSSLTAQECAEDVRKVMALG